MSSLPQPFVNTPVTEWIQLLQNADSPEDRLRALQAIGLLASKDEAGQWATHSLRDTDSTIRALAAKTLGTAGITLTPEADAALVLLLHDEDPDVRFESARSLLRKASANKAKAVSVLLAFLDEDETQPLMVAMILNLISETGALEGLAETDLLPRLKRRLQDERGEVREAIAVAFARWPAMCKPTIDDLVPLLDDSEPVVREKIAEALGQAGILNESIRTALTSASQDEDTEVARVASEALNRLSQLAHE